MRSRRTISVPDNWKACRLREATSRITQRNSSGNTNVLTASAKHGLISQESFFQKRVASMDTRSYFLLRRGDFVYTKSYSEGYPAGVTRRLTLYDSGVVTPLYICFRPHPDALDPQFLEHYFESGILDDDILWIAKEGVRNHGLLNVGIEEFFSLPITIPPLREQQRIAEILDAVDRELIGYDCILKKLERLRVGTLMKSLSRIDSNESADGWTRLRLGEVVPSVQYGISSPLFDEGKGTPVLRMNNVGEGKAGFGEIKFTVDKISTAMILRFGDVLFNRTNSIDQIGRSGMWREETPRATFASYLVRLDMDRTRIIPQYLALWLTHPLVRRRIRSISTPAVQQVNVNPTKLLELEIDLPRSLEEQRLICARLDSADDYIAAQRVRLNKLRLLKKGLMADLLTGKVRVGKA